MILAYFKQQAGHGGERLLFPAMWEAQAGGDWPREKWNPIWKVTKAKWTGDVSQEYLYSKHMPWVKTQYPNHQEKKLEANEILVREISHFFALRYPFYFPKINTDVFHCVEGAI
jgi:hypothetical protein